VPAGEVDHLAARFDVGGVEGSVRELGHRPGDYPTRARLVQGSWFGSRVEAGADQC
jgi:hypothetical protein